MKSILVSFLLFTFLSTASKANTLTINFDFETKVSSLSKKESEEPSPVKLISFAIKAQGKSNVITWETAPRQKIAAFFIEKSQDSFIFESLTTMKVNETNKYEWIDKSPAEGANYYRLKSVSVEGMITYSKIVSAINQFNTISISSNPSNGYFELQSEGNLNLANVFITDLSGRKVFDHANENRNNVSIDLRNEPDGIYFLQIIEAGKTQIHKIIIRK
jgi:hypothetical protein